jgi:cytochrome c553
VQLGAARAVTASPEGPAAIPTNGDRRCHASHTPKDEETTVRSHYLLLAAVVAAATGAALAQAPDPNLARDLAATCSNCHGTNGVSQGGTESLAGMPKADLVRKMQDFKAGRRAATVMQQLAKGYSDEQIDLIAGWYAAQKATK